MRKILALILIFVISGSTCHKRIEKEVIRTTMLSFEDTLTKQELDSMFICDTLSLNIENDWIPSVAFSADNDILYKYVYIKNDPDDGGTIYTLSSYQDTLFIISKRITK